MRRWGAALFLLAAAGAYAQDRDQPDRRGPASRQTANPSAIVAAEIERSRLATRKGEAKALFETAAPDAELFVPERVSAAGWLKNRSDAAVATTWQPYRIWMSCDGTAAASEGAWQRPGEQGHYVTIWKRQEKDGYKWTYTMSDAAMPGAAPEMIAGLVGDCTKNIPAFAAFAAAKRLQSGAASQQGSDEKVDASVDSTLVWRTAATEPKVQVWVARDGGMHQVAGFRVP